MGYADRFYYGQCKLEVIADGDVTVTDGTKTWTGRGTFTLPGTKRYTVTVGDKTETVYSNYGSYIRLNMKEK